jgi:hypothetical protein
MKDIIIIDLDGTLANIEHRLHHIQKEPKDWDSFYDACDKDVPNEWAVKLIEMVTWTTYKIIILSARRKIDKHKTLGWLIKNEIKYDDLFLLRGLNDHTPDYVLKKRWLDSQPEETKERILFVVEDRQRVVDMWRAEGITCLQCAQWEEEDKERMED